MLRLLRLFALSVVGAFFGLGILGPWLLSSTHGYDHGFGESELCALQGAIAGALGGVFVEVLLRSRDASDSRKFFHFNIKELFFATALVAIALGAWAYTRLW